MKLKTALGLSSFQFMVMARRGLFYTFLSIYLRAGLGLSVTATTLLASLTMIANSVSQAFIWGKLSDKYQIRGVLVVVGEVTAAFGYILVYYFHIYLLNVTGPIAAAYCIIAGLSFLEFFWSMSNLGWSALISDLSTSKERGRLMSVISSVGGFGRIAGISVSGVLYDWGGEAGGFRNGILFFFAAAIMLASAVTIWFTTRSTERFSFKARSKDHEHEKTETATARYDHRKFYWFLTSLFIVGLGAFSILQILILYANLDSPIGATSFDIAMIRNSASIAMIITSLLAGPLANKIGLKNTLGLGFLIAFLTPLLYVAAQNATQMILINSLNGVYRALIDIAGYLLASNLIPAERRGRLFGQYNSVTSISFGIAGTFIGGPISDYLISTGATEASTYVSTFQVSSAISLIGSITFALKVKPASPTKCNRRNSC